MHNQAMKKGARIILLVTLTSVAIASTAQAQIQVKPMSAPARLIAELKSKDPMVRRAAANALGGMRARDSVRPLIQLLLDKNPSVREAAAFALGMMTDPRAVDPLLGAMADKDDEVRSSAAFALGMIGERRAIRALSNALDDSSVAVRSSALVGLGLMHDIEGIEEFISMLDDPSVDVRYDAVWSIGQIDDPDAIDHLYAALLDLDLSRIDDSLLEAYSQTVQNSLARLKARKEIITRRRRVTSPIAPIDVENKISRPVAITQSVQAAPTERAIREKVKGSVGLRVLVGAEGYAVRAYVTRRLGYGLDQRAMEAVLQYRFEPELRDGLPQTTWMNMEVKF
ncbi:MAG: HEAT repeat domain-containing protein [Acidobacteriota bacterium]